MIAVDTNLLVYAHRSESIWHEASLQALRELDSTGEPWAIPWPCVWEFYNIVTHPKLFKVPTPPAVALEAISAWQECDGLQCIGEGVGCWEGFAGLLKSLDVRGPKIHDARIALICHYHGVRELWSADRDFSRFPFLKTVNPLVR